jgi:serine/threonine protein kinase
MIEQIKRGDIDRSDYDQLPVEASDFLDSLLQVDPTKRLTAKEAIEHVWVRSYHQRLSEKSLINTQRIDNLQKYSCKAEQHKFVDFVHMLVVHKGSR